MKYLAPLLFLSTPLFAADPCKSGPQPNQRPGPYSAQVAVGSQRGTQHCFICEAADRPLIIVFARSQSEPLGKLVHRMDRLLTEHKAVDLRGWVTFLTDDADKADPKVVAWSKKHATGNIPLAVFDDEVGPPAYLIHREADVTVLLSVKQKVVANFAYRAGELTPAAIDEILKAVPKIVAAK